MARLSARDRARAQAITSHLAVYDAEGPPVLAEAMDAMRDLLGTEKTIGYTLGPSAGDSLRVEQFVGAGDIHPLFFELFDQWLADKTVGWTGYNPVCPEPKQRNVVLTLDEVRRVSGIESTPIERELFPRVSLETRNQLRVLLCDGPSLLAWVGAYQATPFDARQKSLLKLIAPALRKRLVLERQVSTAATYRAAFVTALEVIGAAAFLVGDQGRLIEANEAGKAALLRDPTLTRAALADAARRGAAIDFAVTRVRSHGSPDAFLLVRRELGPTLAVRAESAAVRWRLTPKQAEILALVAEGRSNRAIAAVLGVAERTVETHLTAVYERAQVEGRSQLVARLWEI